MLNLILDFLYISHGYFLQPFKTELFEMKIRLGKRMNEKLDM